METAAFVLVVMAAVLHATWNALVKVAADRLVVLAAVSLGQGTLGLILIPFVPVPSRGSWTFILISTLLHYGYAFFLFHSYRYGDLSQVYPLVRGLAPVLVTVGALIFAHEFVPLAGFAGIAIVSIGICGLAWFTASDARLNSKGIIFASSTALTIAAYTVSDGMGVRLTESPLSFIAWLFIFEFPVVAFAIFHRRRRLYSSLMADGRKFIGCALCSTAAYAMVIFSSAYIPLAFVSTLRETSVIMATLIGVSVLGERPWKQRVCMSFVVAAGVVLLSIAK